MQFPDRETGHQKVRLGDRAEAVQLSALFFVRYAAAAKEPVAQRCFAGAVVSRQGVAHDVKSGYRSNSETTDKRIEASVFFSSFGSFVFRFFHHPKRFRNNFQQGKRKGETECIRHFPWNWPDVR